MSNTRARATNCLPTVRFFCMPVLSFHVDACCTEKREAAPDAAMRSPSVVGRSAAAVETHVQQQSRSHQVSSHSAFLGVQVVFFHVDADCAEKREAPDALMPSRRSERLNTAPVANPQAPATHGKCARHALCVLETRAADAAQPNHLRQSHGPNWLLQLRTHALAETPDHWSGRTTSSHRRCSVRRATTGNRNAHSVWHRQRTWTLL